MPKDTIEIEIMDDGSFKILTSQISMANHRDADELLDYLTQLAGGKRSTKSRNEKPHTHKHGNTTHTHN